MSVKCLVSYKDTKEPPFSRRLNLHRNEKTFYGSKICDISFRL